MLINTERYIECLSDLTCDSRRTFPAWWVDHECEADAEKAGWDIEKNLCPDCREYERIKARADEIRDGANKIAGLAVIRPFNAFEYCGESTNESQP